MKIQDNITENTKKKGFTPEMRQRGRETMIANREARKTVGFSGPPRQTVSVLRKAIQAKCADCCGEEDVYKRTKHCDISACPLFAIRPFQKTDN